MINIVTNRELLASGEAPVPAEKEKPAAEDALGMATADPKPPAKPPAKRHHVLKSHISFDRSVSGWDLTALQDKTTVYFEVL